MKRLKLVFWLVVLAVGLVAVPASMHAAPFAYVANYENFVVKVIDTADNKVVDAIAVSWHPHSFAIHPDGKTVYIAGEYFIQVIDACTNKVVATIDSDYIQHTGIAVHPSGSTVYFTSNYRADWDYAVSVVDTSTNEVTATIPIDNNPSEVAVHPSGDFIYVSHAEGIAVIDTDTNAVTTTIAINGPKGLAFHPSGSPLYAAGVDYNTVAVVDTTTNTVIDTIEVENGAHDIAVHPSGAFVYVANQEAMTVSMIDTATNTVTKTKFVDDNPNGIAVHPSGDFIYVPLTSWVNVYDSLELEFEAQVLSVGIYTVAHGYFIGPEVTCGEDELEQCQEDLAAAGQTISALETTIASQEAVINSFLTYVFGASADANVAEAARNMTRETIDQATANVGANDRRVRLAERFFDRGVAALAAQDFRRAMSLFQKAFRFAQQAL